MPFLRQTLRWTIRLAVGVLIAAALFVAGSFAYGEWYFWRTEAAQQEVWSAYLAPRPGSQATGPAIVVQDRTEPAGNSLVLALSWPVGLAASERPLPSVQAGMYFRWMLARLRSHPIRSLNPSRPTRLARSPWTENVGYVTLTPVGFNPDRTRALFHTVGPHCGMGDLIVMRKVDDHWIVVDSRTVGW